MILNSITVSRVVSFVSTLHVCTLLPALIIGTSIMTMVHGTIFTLHTTLGIITGAGAMAGLGGLGIVGMAVSGGGIILMLGHIGGGDLVGTIAIPYIMSPMRVTLCLVNLILLVGT